MNKLLKKLPAIIVILFIVSQSFLYSSAYGVSPWSGNSWTGNDWSGSPWEGNSWEGNSWSGQEWQGNTWNGQEWQGTDWNGEMGGQGSGFNGTEWQGVPWSYAPWGPNAGPVAPGFEGGAGTVPVPPYLSPMNPGAGGVNVGGTLPNGTVVAPGNVVMPNPYAPGTSLYPGMINLLQPGGYDLNGNSVTAGSSDPAEIKKPKWVEVTEYLTKDVVFGQVGLATSALQKGENFGFKDVRSFHNAVIWGGLKLGLGENETFKFVDDTITSGTIIKDGYQAIQKIQTINQANQTAQAGAGVTQAMQAAGGAVSTGANAATASAGMGVLTKFNIATASVGTFFGAVDTGFKTANAVEVFNSDAATTEKVSATADATASLGQTIMSAGVTAGFFPGGQAAAPFLIAGGAILWGGSRLVKLAADNWGSIKKFGSDFKSDPLKATGDLAKNTYEGAKDKLSSGWNSVKGLFGN
ncbi:hypothetical protein [Jeotgalibacillus sp. R-1-5s-1]|uniref:hypothetical protein n=1 Tax=Jeotgalibacillus sp. R-1-5s-1 TaxID=2555897 RepID=UPI00106A66B8|nr:hypothetical protein [Jeotgalibacillus sp. R-1-5s-1]TFD99391.1 hypothetical protein E2491_08005 [Jeotgalibacillus sp. R-1-5s-1]